ncbi:MAG TPA: hypothetical protein VEW08_09060 [Steroidobacteraceae bacterium]|nr:hypothetical protein [Steroidobacteraceae bacterium]
MRRPINWFVFCLSLAFLFANVSLSRKASPPVELAAIPVTAELDFSHVILAETTPPLFGYIRDDGSFMPLAQQSPKPSATSKVPARF